MNLWTGTLDLLFPHKCPFCQTLLEEKGALLCPNCQTTLPWLGEGTKERRVDFTNGCLSPLAYRGSVPDAIRRYKFNRLRSYERTFGILMAQCVQDRLKAPINGVVWVPLSHKRLRERGFDQAELLARRIGESLSLPVIPALEKIRHTGTQSDLETESARRANALGAYALRPDADVAGKHLLLVDDVVTSGATLSECARMVLEGGASDVWCVTLSQARSG